jgi:hypothetical protein
MVNYQLAVVYTRHEKVIAMKPWAGIFNFFFIYADDLGEDRTGEYIF